jgi:pheromone receptor transcription factor
LPIITHHGTMASEITEQEANSPSAHDDQGNGSTAPEQRGIKRQRTSNAAAADDDDDDDDKPGRERRKIEIKFIQDKSRRHITFSKRKAGIMKKVRQHRPHYLLALRVATCLVSLPADAAL